MLLAIRKPSRTLELACFLRLQLMRLTDMALDLVDRRIAKQWREARKRVEEGQRGRLQHFHGPLGLANDLSETARSRRVQNSVPLGRI
jgi:hypothetical protein